MIHQLAPDRRPKIFLLVSEDLNAVMFDSRDFPGKTVEQVFTATQDGKSPTWVNELGEEDVGYSVWSTLDMEYPLDYDGTSETVVDRIRADFQHIGYII